MRTHILNNVHIVLVWLGQHDLGLPVPILLFLLTLFAKGIPFRWTRLIHTISNDQCDTNGRLATVGVRYVLITILRNYLIADLHGTSDYLGGDFARTKW